MEDLIAHGIKITEKRPELLGPVNDRIKQCQERIDQNPDSRDHEINLAYIALNTMRDKK